MIVLAHAHEAAIAANRARARIFARLTLLTSSPDARPSRRRTRRISILVASISMRELTHDLWRCERRLSRWYRAAHRARKKERT